LRDNAPAAEGFSLRLSAPDRWQANSAKPEASPHPSANAASDWNRTETSEEYRCPEPLPPEPDGFMADVDAALVQQILDVAERQGKPDA